MAAERPRRPAAAYVMVAEILPDWYWKRPPPVSGIRVQVRGADRVWTSWEMGAELARWLMTALSARRVDVRSESYSPRPA